MRKIVTDSGYCPNRIEHTWHDFRTKEDGERMECGLTERPQKECLESTCPLRCMSEEEAKGLLKEYVGLVLLAEKDSRAFFGSHRKEYDKKLSEVESKLIAMIGGKG